ncbi:MAG: rod shape-determining protein MreD [Aquificae bacterium]|nr:rod shape-determining protein MreD [Aquificota bacterium]
MKAYLTGLLLVLFQTSVLSKYFSVGGVVPDFLTIFVILYALKNPVKQSVKLALFVGILQDLLSPVGLVFNTLTKVLIVFITNLFKEKFYYSSFLVKGLLVLAVISIDIGIKSSILFFKTGVFEISHYHLVYLAVNFLVFYGVSLVYET